MWGSERTWDEDGYQASYARLSTMWPGSQMFIHSSKRNLLNMSQDHSKCRASPQEQDSTFLSNGLRKGREKVVCLCGASHKQRQEEGTGWLSQSDPWRISEEVKRANGYLEGILAEVRLEEHLSWGGGRGIHGGMMGAAKALWDFGV